MLVGDGGGVGRLTLWAVARSVQAFSMVSLDLDWAMRC